MNTKKDSGFLTTDEYIERRSATLLQNPNAKLEEKLEIDNYVIKFNSEYLKEIEELSSISTKPLSTQTRIIVTIIAFGEATRIRKTLNNYVKQDIDHNHFEIIVLDNHPESVARDNTFTEIEKFKMENPLISVVYAHKIWKKGEQATVGNARKYVFDIAVLRIKERGSTEKDMILISNDADTIDLDSNYLSSIVTEFDSNPKIDALVTLVVVPKNVIVKPNMYAVLSLWDALDEVVAHNEPYNLRGASSAYRASIYVAVGGYNPGAKQAEDLETGWLIADAREWNPNSVIQFKKTKYVQDPRRLLMAMASRIPVNEMYFDFDSKPEIRQADNETLISLLPDYLDWELFEEDADSFWQGRSTGMYKWRGDRFTSDFKQAMDKIGIEYEIVNDRVNLKNINKLVLNYKNDFGEDVVITHSTPRPWDEKRQNDIKVFFSSISDGIISARNKMTNILSAKIKEAQKEKGGDDLTNLLKEFKRFAGHEYVE